MAGALFAGWGVAAGGGADAAGAGAAGADAAGAAPPVGDGRDFGGLPALRAQLPGAVNHRMRDLSINNNILKRSILNIKCITRNTKRIVCAIV